MGKPLTDEQLQSFRANGFLHIKGLVPLKELEAVRRDTKDLIDRGIDRKIDDPTYCYGADALDASKQCLYRINHLVRGHGHESFKLLVAYPPLLEAISQAVGGDYFTTQVESCVFKIPHRGYPVPWHQDPVAVYHFPVFNVDVYLDEANPGNGGLYVIPGSHLAGYHGTPQFIRAITEGKEHDAPGAIPVHTQPGDVLFHATSVLHGSFWNRSQSLRRTIYYHINHYRDVRMRPLNDGHRSEYLRSQEVMLDAIATRRRKYPNETPFPYRPLDPALLEAAEPATVK